MRTNFGNICVGDMFHTDIARWVKINDKEAISVMSQVCSNGTIKKFENESQIDLIWSCLIKFEQKID